ncbi:MAG: PD-(D/E)XK nuclease family protein [Bacteroidota bacterium]
MQPFLSKITDHIFKNYKDDISRLCIVLPNRRGGLFLKKYIGKKYKKTIWSPEIFAIEDFIKELSGVEILDNVTLLFKFYKIYCEQTEETELPKQASPSEMELEGGSHSFDQFIKWAPVLLNDFNEMDEYLADTDKLFAYVNEARAIQVWNLENPELSPNQKSYLMFWKSLGKYYEKLKEELESKNQAYQGMAYRKVSNEISTVEGGKKLKERNWKKILFAGFNALTKAEETIIEKLISIGMAEMLWDADTYYTQNQTQEAGRFIAKYKKKWKPNDFKWEENILSTDNKEINIIGIAQNVNQAKYTGEILFTSPPKSPSPMGEGDLDVLHSKATGDGVAVVLADENFLAPVLNSLPGNISDVNVTMGYPLKNTPLYGLFDAILNLHVNSPQNPESSSYPGKTKEGFKPGKDQSFYYKDVLKVLNHPYLDQPMTSIIARKIQKKNKVFISSNDIEQFVTCELQEDLNILKPVFSSWNDPGEKGRSVTENALDCFYGLISHFKDFLISEDENKTIELEYLYAFAKLIKRLKTLLKDHDLNISSEGEKETTLKPPMDIKTFRTIFNQLVKAEKLSFYGEPLKGLQIMGMLETRTLDFETVILLSANENILPSGKTQNSFIPYDIRREFGLPTYSDRNAISAYHFYRLIQRAKKIYLLYNTEPDEFGSGEKSRFITQLLHELPKVNKNIKITEQLITLPILKVKKKDISIEKDDDILNRLNAWIQRGVSPSALNTYINCPLDFYYKYVLGLEEAEEVEETIEAATLGKCVHHVLRDLYAEFEGKNISINDVVKMKPFVEQKTIKAFSREYSAADIHHGKNLLILNVAIRFIENFLKEEVRCLSEIEKEGKSLVIRSLEEKLEMSMKMTLNGVEKRVNFRGTADRIDLVGDTTRIIDYKTGLVQPADLKPGDFENIANDPKYDKAFQLLMYALMYNKNPEGLTGSLITGIISFRRLSQGLMPVIIYESTEINEEILRSFEDRLKMLMSRIYDMNTPFRHNEEAEYCRFCGE